MCDLDLLPLPYDQTSNFTNLTFNLENISIDKRVLKVLDLSFSKSEPILVQKSPLWPIRIVNTLQKEPSIYLQPLAP